MGKRHRALRALLALACAGAVALTALTGAVCAAAGMEREATRSDCIIVLGARVWPDGRLSDSLLYRVKTNLKCQNSFAKVNETGVLLSFLQKLLRCLYHLGDAVTFAINNAGTFFGRYIDEILKCCIISPRDT